MEQIQNINNLGNTILQKTELVRLDFFCDEVSHISSQLEKFNKYLEQKYTKLCEKEAT